MKTILVKLNGVGPTFCYKTKDESIKYGDVLEILTQTTAVVTAVVDKEYKYVNTRTGDLTDELNSTYCVPIKTLVLKSNDDIVYAYKIDNTNLTLKKDGLGTLRT